jgi:hypothetical protein
MHPIGRSAKPAIIAWSLESKGTAKTMKRPAGVTLIALLIVSVAAILALGSLGFFSLAVMAATDGISGDPVSAAITGMAFGGGFSLLVLTSVAVGLAIAVFKLQEWAWSASIASIGMGTVFAIISIFAFRRLILIPLGVSLICHLLTVAAAAWMLSYLLKPGVKQAFSVTSA